MVATVKFSQFLGPTNSQAGDIVVGLRGGKNYQFYAGTGGGGGVTQTLTQPGNSFVVGNWVRIDASGQYVLAQADTAQDAEVIGVIVQIVTPGSVFVLQQSGYVTTAMAVFSGLVDGDVYFLDTATLGTMVNVDATINGQVSRPVFVADTPTSGWVVPYRGLIVGGAAPPGPTPSSSDELIVTVNQTGHGFIVGNWIRVNTDNTTGPVSYTRAFADTLANSQAVGVVIQVVNANQFVLQFAGYNTGAVTIDDMSVALISSTTYYLSNSVMGAITSIDPITTGGVSKPLYISEQTTNFLGGVNAGYILPQRPLGGNSPISGHVFLGYLNAANNFADTNILTGYNTYFMLFQNNISCTGSSTPSSIGIQLYISGAYDGTLACTTYVQGINNMGAGTLWGQVVISQPSLVLFPALYNNAVLTTGYAYLTVYNSLYDLEFQVFTADNPVTIGYTGNGQALKDGPPGATGMRVFFSGTGATIGGTGYVAVYGIPNS